jgi:hypothetical protein
MAGSDFPQSLSPFQPEVRRIWHRGEWYYAVVDIIAFLTESKDPGGYWRNTKKRLLDDEGAGQALDQLVQLKLKAQDGRFRLTDTANRQILLRLMQSIPVLLQRCPYYGKLCLILRTPEQFFHEPAEPVQMASL